MRGDGTHQYHFANDLAWSGGPGYYFSRRHDMIIRLQFVASGEYKDVDRFRGKKAEDTGITSVFVGPGWSLPAAASAPKSLSIFQSRSTTRRYKSCPIIDYAEQFHAISDSILRSELMARNAKCRRSC